MRKFFIITLVFLIAFSFIACSKDNSRGNPAEPTDNNSNIEKNSSDDTPQTATEEQPNVTEPAADNSVQNVQAVSPWTRKKDMPVKMFTHRSVVINDKIYVLGTMDRYDDYNTLYEYDPSADSWTKKASTLAGKGTVISGGGAAAANGKLYTFGGGYFKDENDFVMTYNVQEYDPSSDEWVLKGELPKKNYAFGTAVIDNRIYIVGGEASVLEEYDPQANEWIEKSGPNIYYQDAGTIAVNGRIYAFSGARTPLVSVYDPKTDAWTLKSPIITSRIHIFPVAIDGLIYAINGIKMAGMKYSNDVEVYDTENDSWSAKSTSPFASYSSAYAAVKGRIYMIGGEGEDSTQYCVYEYDPGLDK